MHILVVAFRRKLLWPTPGCSGGVDPPRVYQCRVIEISGGRDTDCRKGGDRLSWIKGTARMSFT